MNKQLIIGDCLKELDKIEENSIDAIITDPPYELNFMGKGWDNAGVSFNKNTWEKCLRVLKPGGYLLTFGGSRTFHRIACAIEDAGFEIRDTIMWIYGCYSEDTQVLTNEGWKYFYELDKTEKILQWDKDTNNLSWAKPEEYFEYEIKDDMVLLENRHTSQLVTKNHRVYAKITKRRKKKDDIYTVNYAGDIKKSWIVDLPLAGNLYDGAEESNAYIIGWWLTDAWKHKDGKACMFSQSKRETLNKLRSWLDQHNIRYSEYVKKAKKKTHQDEHIFYVNDELSYYLRGNFPNRELTIEVLGWDYNSRLNLLAGLMDGDGTIRKNSYNHIFWSKNRQRLDIFQALVLSLNMRSHIDYKKGCVYFNVKKNTTQLQQKHKKPNQSYKGKVYCLQTKTGAFVVRRNGKAFISGNSGFPKSMNIGLAVDKKKGIESKVVGAKTQTGVKSKLTQQLVNNGGFNDPNPTVFEVKEAQNEWRCWGTSLKPAFEPIIVARKPFKGTLVDNILEYGVGGLNIDECRVGNEERTQFSGRSVSKSTVYNEFKQDNSHYETVTGRFPANIIHDGSEEATRDMPKTKGSQGKGFKKGDYGFGETATSFGRGDFKPYNDSGSAARYFMNCKYTEKDEEIWKQLLVNNVENNLEISKATKDNIVQMNVEDLLKELKDHYARYAGNQLDLIETPIVQDIAEMLTWDSKIETSQVIQDFIINSKKCIQFLSLVQFVEKMDNIDTTQTTQNLLKLFGYVKVAITNYIQGNIEYDQKRYIYTPKASKKDRDEGLDEFEPVDAGIGALRDGNRNNTEPRRNVHPTVKPTALMQYLVRLVCPKGSVILDPFMGSGSTGKAVAYENKERNAGYSFIGIEQNPEYVEIAKARIEFANIDNTTDNNVE